MYRIYLSLKTRCRRWRGDWARKREGEIGNGNWRRCLEHAGLVTVWVVADGLGMDYIGLPGLGTVSSGEERSADGAMFPVMCISSVAPVFLSLV